MSTSTTRLFRTIAGGVLLLCNGGCANWALSIPARGEIGGQRLETNVESEASLALVRTLIGELAQPAPPCGSTVAAR